MAALLKLSLCNASKAIVIFDHEYAAGTHRGLLLNRPLLLNNHIHRRPRPESEVSRQRSLTQRLPAGKAIETDVPSLWLQSTAILPPCSVTTRKASGRPRPR